MAEPENNIAPPGSYASIGSRIAAIPATGSRLGWLLVFSLCLVLTLLFLYTVILVFTVGVGLLGINIPVAWGFPLVNVVWWIGIGHAGTLISAILLLLRQDWRASINRFAEAMTLFAAGIAGLFPIIHLGRPEYFYWLLPYPATMDVWPQWRSPLVWDFFAIATYITVSLLFWYLGLIPDLASMRDRAGRSWRGRLYGLFALGWRGAASHWRRYQTAYLILAGLATPLVVSVHSIIALDFAVTLVPGYHTQIFPPYFVAGAVFSGFAMVLTLAIPMRRIFRLEQLITLHHLDMMARIMLTAGLVVCYGYAMEHFVIWYSGDKFERYMALNRMFGPYAEAWWVMMTINVLVTQSLWWGKVRHSPWLLFCIAIVINIGMWLERYVIVITSVHRGFLPSAWDTSTGTWMDWAMLVGSLGLFATLFLLFIKLVPAISIYEEKELAYEYRQQHRHHNPDQNQEGEA